MTRLFESLIFVSDPFFSLYWLGSTVQDLRAALKPSTVVSDSEHLPDHLLPGTTKFSSQQNQFRNYFQIGFLKTILCFVKCGLSTY